MKNHTPTGRPSLSRIRLLRQAKAYSGKDPLSIVLSPSQSTETPMRLALFVCLIALTTVACSNDEESELETYRSIELLSRHINEWLNRSDDSDFGIQLVCKKELNDLDQWAFEDFISWGYDEGYVLYSDRGRPFGCLMLYADWVYIPSGTDALFPKIRPIPTLTP